MDQGNLQSLKATSRLGVAVAVSISGSAGFPDISSACAGWLARSCAGMRRDRTAAQWKAMSLRACEEFHLSDDEEEEVEKYEVLSRLGFLASPLHVLAGWLVCRWE